MDRTELLALHDEITKDAKSIMEAKNQDYTGGTNDPFANFRASAMLGVSPELGILMRCLDKFQRIRSFIVNGELAVKEEPVDDAIRDVVNYMVLLAGMVREQRLMPAPTEWDCDGRER